MAFRAETGTEALYLICLLLIYAEEKKGFFDLGMPQLKKLKRLQNLTTRSISGATSLGCSPWMTPRASLINARILNAAGKS